MLAEHVHNKIVASPEVFQRVNLHVKVLAEIMDEFSSALHRNRKSPYTQFIGTKHKERTSLLAALRRQINTSLKLVYDPVKIQAAKYLKERMKNARLWIYDTISYYETSLIIRGLMLKCEEKSFSQPLTELGVDKIIEDLSKTQEQFEALRFKRVDHKLDNKKPQKKVTRRKLIQALYPLLSVIDFGAVHEPQVFAGIAGYIKLLIRDTNALTRTRQTHSQNKKAHLQKKTVFNPPELKESQQPDENEKDKKSTFPIDAGGNGSNSIPKDYPPDDSEKKGRSG